MARLKELLEFTKHIGTGRDLEKRFGQSRLRLAMRYCDSDSTDVGGKGQRYSLELVTSGDHEKNGLRKNRGPIAGSHIIQDQEHYIGFNPGDAGMVIA